MARLTKMQDGFGRGIYDWHMGREGVEIGERDDGWIDTTAGPGTYFTEYAEWRPVVQEAADMAAGRVLDVGCGAGRVALHLQSKGLDVMGIDVSPLAIKVCRLRGVKQAKVMSITEVGPALGTFDTIVMFGNNFGLFGSFKRARWLLRRFRNLTSPGARIIAQTLDPYDTDQPGHKAYHRANRRRGRMGGQIRLRIRYLNYCTPWFDYLMVSETELRRIVAGTGWRVARILRQDQANPRYTAVLEKEKPS